ncbi:MAG: polyphosphate:AMP phosphotransferase [Candidatus Competibacterales bacterium]|nr:polyphosphate:AMP phosphotransferase [Candidatus Competibacterales bacterium]
MFKDAEQGQKVSKSDFKKREAELRQTLLAAQQKLLEHKRFPVIILFAGVDAAGKSETVNLLSAWMDPRWLVTRAYDKPSDETQERPEFWRYWRDLPPKGQIGMFLSAWYSIPVLDRVYGQLSSIQLEHRLARIRHFEQTLNADGALIIKFWMHLSRKQQQKRLRALENDPLLSWRVSQQDWDNWRRYDDFIHTAEQVIERTTADLAPWYVVEGWDANYRNLRVGEILSDNLQHRLQQKPTPAKTKPAAKPDQPLPQFSPLQQLDLSLKLSKPVYHDELKRLQAELNRWHRLAAQKGTSTILVFEGPDAAGKGGTIRRITAALDARRYQVLPFAAPTDEERAHHYLWRFWRHLGRAGRVMIFDRSWYGRVLVERVEGYAGEPEWKRAYDEINDFEAQLIEHGIVLVKYWLQIDPHEQLARFKDREKTAHKRWKLTDEDWRNREKWDQYQHAVHDMIEYTSTEIAPWRLIEANDKRHARIKTLRVLCEKLEEVLQR